MYLGYFPADEHIHCPQSFYHYLRSCVSSGAFGKFLLGIYPEKLMNYKAYEMYGFIKECKTTSYSYLQSQKRFCWSTVAPTPDTINFLNFAKWMDIKYFHYSTDLHFPNYCDYLFKYLLAIFISSPMKGLSIFCPSFNWAYLSLKLIHSSSLYILDTNFWSVISNILPVPNMSFYFL